MRRLGVTTVNSAPDLTMVVHLLSPNDRYDMTYLRNYAVLNVKDRLARIQGVGQVQLGCSGCRFHAVRVLILTRLCAKTPCPHQVRAPWMPVSSVRFQP